MDSADQGNGLSDRQGACCRGIAKLASAANSDGVDAFVCNHPVWRLMRGGSMKRGEELSCSSWRKGKQDSQECRCWQELFARSAGDE